MNHRALPAPLARPAAAALVLWLAACAPAPPRPADAARQADVARRGAAVMPFDLAATLHVFTKAADGGEQQVLARRPDDRAQIALIRGHLQELRQQFLAGDFSAPAQIHGRQMPGLAALQAAPRGAVAIDYAERPAGAALRYRSGDPALVDALQAWFDAQLADHGPDAIAGHDHAHMHGAPPPAGENPAK
jgi:hypothetical protein